MDAKRNTDQRFIEDLKFHAMDLFVKVTIAAVLLGLFQWMGLVADQDRKERIAEYEKSVAEGHPIQYGVMGIPVDWTPYDE